MTAPGGGDEPGALAHADERQAFYSGRASEVARALTLAGLGLVWLFGPRASADAPSALTTLADVRSSRLLTTALVLFVLAVIADLVHYIAGAALWAAFRWTGAQVIAGRTSPRSGLTWQERLAWRLARPFRILALLEAGAPGKTPRRLAARRDRVRAPAADEPAVPAALASPISPPFINLATRTAFVAKLALALAGYLAFGLYVLRS